MKLIVHTDGGARGNPGPAAIGVVIDELLNEGDPSTSSGRTTDLKEVVRFGKTIGETTNNVAEYTAVIEALEKAKSFHPTDIQFFLDSTLVVNQLNGIFKIKDANLRTLVLRVKMLEQEVGGRITYQAVRREENKRADLMVNQALDADQ